MFHICHTTVATGSPQGGKLQVAATVQGSSVRSLCHPLPPCSAAQYVDFVNLLCVECASLQLAAKVQSSHQHNTGLVGHQDTNKVLAISRIMVAWQPVGLCMGVYDMCNRYLKERQQFGTPLAAFQVRAQCRHPTRLGQGALPCMRSARTPTRSVSLAAFTFVDAAEAGQKGTMRYCHGAGTAEAHSPYIYPSMASL